MRKKYNRSPLFYVGDKYKLLKEIIPVFPKKIERFIEPFTGGGSVFLNVSAEKFLLNDIDKYVYSLHNFLKEHAQKENVFFEKVGDIIYHYGLSRSYVEDIVPNELKEKYKKTYYAHFNKESFKRLKDDFNNSVEIDLYQFYVLLIYGFNRMIRFNSAGQYNLPVGNVDFNKNVITALKNYFSIVKNKDIEWSNLDFLDFLDKTNPTEKDFVYLDPPYLITFSEYNKLWKEEDEYRLVKKLDELNAKNVKFAVSNVFLYKGKENKIFSQWMQKYKVIPIQSNYISYHDNSIKNFSEVLVINYENE